MFLYINILTRVCGFVMIESCLMRSKTRERGNLETVYRSDFKTATTGQKLTHTPTRTDLQNSSHTVSCYSLTFCMFEGMDCKFKNMSSREGKLDYTWVRCLWLAVESKGCKNDCEDMVKAQKVE